jgi:hypothetical protein
VNFNLIIAAVQGWKTRKRYTLHPVLLGPTHRGRDLWAHGACCFDCRAMRHVCRSEQRGCKAGGTRSGTGVTWSIHSTCSCFPGHSKILNQGPEIGRLAKQARPPRLNRPISYPCYWPSDAFRIQRLALRVPGATTNLCGRDSSRIQFSRH